MLAAPATGRSANRLRLDHGSTRVDLPELFQTDVGSSQRRCAAATAAGHPTAPTRKSGTVIPRCTVQLRMAVAQPTGSIVPHRNGERVNVACSATSSGGPREDA